jgi:hypothetical protein
MAFRTWGRLLLTALGVSVLAGAGQLGIGYGFGIVRLGGVFTDDTVNRWPAQLVWVGWFAAVAAVAGAVLTERLARRDGFPGGTTQQLSVAGAAALGATVVAPLCMQPARAAELNTVDPVWAVGICAILGAVVGAGAAIAVLLRPPLGWNVVLSAAVVWLLALVSAAPSLASTGPLPTVRLGVLEPSWLDPAAAQRLAMLILPTLSLLAGATVGALARRRGHPPLVGGAAGAAGPVLVAFAYLTAGPGDPADRYQLAPYYGALIAVAAGALGSAATTVLRRPAPADGAIEPDELLRPLPASPDEVAPPAPAAGTIGAVVPAGAGEFPAAVRTPAHWDWPVTPGATPPPADVAPTPAGPAASPTAPDRPAAGDEPVRNRPVPGGLPPARRTSAIDVLAAGRPTPAEAAPEPAVAAASADAPDQGVRTAAAPATDEPSGEPTPRPASAGRTAAAPTGGPRKRAPKGRTATTPIAPAATAPGTAPTGPDTASTGLDAVSDIASAGLDAGSDIASAGSAVAPTGGADGPATTPGPVPDTDRTTGSTPPAGQEDRPAETAADTPTAAPPVGRVKRPRRSRANSPAATPPADGTGPVDPTPAEPTDTGIPAAAGTSPHRMASTSTSGTTSTDSTVATDRTAGAGSGTAGPDDPATSVDATGGHDAPAAGGPTDATVGGTPSAGSPSPRPRLPIFSDDQGRPGEVRPAWPVTPAPAWPVSPRAADTPEPSAAGPDASTPTLPTPRPRHRALPDLSRATTWDAFGNVPRPAGAEEADAPTTGRPTDPRPLPQAGDGDRPAGGQEPVADEGAEPAAGKSRLKRGLFRRNRAKAGTESAAERPAREPDAVPAHDEEYVDWVTGLARPAPEADESRPLRTGRHHRD